jgi:hypothetical protein
MMPRIRWVPLTGEWVPLERSVPKARVYIQTDRMDPLYHPCDGNTYDSKSQFRLVTKMHDCVEIGPHKPEFKQIENPDPTAEVVKAFEMVEQGYKPRPYGGADETIDKNFKEVVNQKVDELNA